MKIAIINAASGAGEALTRIVAETLAELGEEVVHIKLDRIRIPFFSTSEKSPTDREVQIVHDAIYEIMSATGAVFVVPVILGGTSALMKAFLEHFSPTKFTQGLMDKNCMVVAAPLDSHGGARETLEYMGKLIVRLGGYDAVRIGVPNHALPNIENGENRFLVEKLTEDYYRVLRQNRKFFDPDEHFLPRDKDSKESEDDDVLDKELKIRHVRELKEKTESRTFTEAQEEDISEIARFITGRLSKPQTTGARIQPKRKTCRQLTASLPHYYNPQLAGGMHSVIGINITGEEVFSGTLTIDALASSFEEGASQDGAEMSITADTKVWTDILTGKYTAQKAFMIGQLKVRGNFLLLSKLEQLFNKMEL